MSSHNVAVTQKTSVYALEANVLSLEAQDRVLGALLDERA